MAVETNVFGTLTSFTLTLASLASGSARQASQVDNSTNKFPAVILYFIIESGGTAPTAGGTYEIYLIRYDKVSSPTYASDNAGTSDAAITIENAILIGAIVVTNTTNKKFYGEFDTRPFGPLGPAWTIAVKNNTTQALNGTEANHLYEYLPYQVQMS